MGNTSAIYAYSVSDPRTISLSQLDKTQDTPYRKIWRSKLTFQQFEEYSVYNRSNVVVEQQMTNYQRRRQQEAGLVSVKYVENIINKEGTMGPSWRQYRVFTERIPTTLDQVACMSLPSALLLLERAFIGFNILFKEVGFFDVSESMIGIDSKNMPKVWMNSCWGSNEPLNKGMLSGNLTHFEGIMVKRIFQLVELHIREEEIGNYMYEKNKIQQWTFELAKTFVNYIVKGESIMLPNKLVFSKKTTNFEAFLKGGNTRKEFSLKDPTYSLNLTITQSQPSISSARNNPNSKFMFDSAQFSARNQDGLGSKPKPSYTMPSPKSVVGKSFSGITGLDFKQSTIKTKRRDQSQSIAKSNCAKKRHSEIFGFGFNQKKNTRLQDHLNGITIERETSEKGLNVSSPCKDRSFTYVKNEDITIKSYEIEETKKPFIMERKLEIQIPSSASQITMQKSQNTIKFKDGSKKDDKSSNSRSSGIQKSKLFSLDFNLLPESTFYNSTIQSTGFYSPMTKPKSHLFKNVLDQKVGVLFSQEILKQKSTFDELLNKTPSTVTPFLYHKGKDIQHSQIIAESNQEISDFPDKVEENKKAKTFLSQSITLEEMMVQPNKKCEKPLQRLDDYIMTKTMEKMEGSIKNDDVDMKNPNPLTHSYFQQ